MQQRCTWTLRSTAETHLYAGSRILSRTDEYQGKAFTCIARFTIAPPRRMEIMVEIICSQRTEGPSLLATPCASERRRRCS
jgi:hypothetical protein